MQNCNSSARTAAKQSSKSSLLFRLPCILAMLLLAAGLLGGCGRGKKIPKKITTKSYLTFFNQPMPTGICRFFYKEYENDDTQEFQDSCHKYSVGDTLR